MATHSNAAPSLPVGIPSMLANSDRYLSTAPLVNIAQFKASYAATLQKHALDEDLQPNPAEPPPEWEAIASACRIDDVVEDVNRHFSGPVLTRVLDKKGAGAPDTASGRDRLPAPPETTTDATARAELSAAVAARVAQSSLTVVRNVRAIASLVERAKPRKDFNYAAVDDGGRAMAAPVDDYFVNADDPAERTGVDEALASSGHHPIAWPERPSLKTREFLVLGSQYLSDLRDQFPCPMDKILDGPTRHSAFFFIEKVFYNDMRLPENMDYSRPILEWAQRPDRQRMNPHLVGLQSSNMETTRWDMLSLRINQSYIYCHQGNCQHRMVVRSIRLLHPHDPQDKQAYPRLIFQTRVRRPKCRLCDLFPAKFVTYGDRLTTENPSFFCERCYDMFHYDANGSILYSDFAVFDYEPD